MKKHRGWVGLCAVAVLSGCATGLVSSWKAPDAEAFRMQGEKVAAVVMVKDPILRFAGEDALARELSARGARGVPMYTLLPGPALDEARARAAAEQAGVAGVVALRPVLVDKEISSRPAAWSGPMYAGFWGGYYGFGWGAPWSSMEIRTDTIIVVETLVYSLTQNKLVWGGQSKTTNPAGLDRLIRSTARQVADELERQGLIEAHSGRPRAKERDSVVGREHRRTPSVRSQDHPSISPFVGHGSRFGGSYRGGMKQDRSFPRTAPSSDVVVAFELTDTGESFHVAARHGVTTVASGTPDGAEATVRLPHRIWIALLLGLTSLGDALLAEDVEADGDLATFTRFHRRFHTASPASLSRADVERALSTLARKVEGETS